MFKNRSLLLSIAFAVLSATNAIAAVAVKPTTDWMQEILKQVSGWLGDIHSAIPYVKTAVLQVTAMGCTYGIIQNGIGFLLGLIFAYISYRLVLNGTRLYKENNYSDRETPFYVCAGFIGIPAACLIIGNFLYLIDFWSWTCIYHPDLYLIHRAVTSLGG